MAAASSSLPGQTSQLATSCATESHLLEELFGGAPSSGRARQRSPGGTFAGDQLPWRPAERPARVLEGTRGGFAKVSGDPEGMPAEGRRVPGGV